MTKNNNNDFTFTSTIKVHPETILNYLKMILTLILTFNTGLTE